MKRIARDAQDDQNYDSFLDIVANLVGILVILIMVIGVRAREASQSQVAAEPSTSSAQTLIIPMPEETGPVVSLNQHRAVEEQIAQLSDSMQTAKSNSISGERNWHKINRPIWRLLNKSTNPVSNWPALSNRSLLSKPTLATRKSSNTIRLPSPRRCLALKTTSS